MIIIIIIISSTFIIIITSIIINISITKPLLPKYKEIGNNFSVSMGSNSTKRILYAFSYLILLFLLSLPCVARLDSEWELCE